MKMPFVATAGLALLLISAFGGTLQGQTPPPQMPTGQPSATGFDDHQNMMDQVGVKALRPGPNPNSQSAFDEAAANPYKDTMPDALRMRGGARVTKASQWPKRRAEIAEDFEREVYGRIPKNVPQVTWEVTATTPGSSGGIPIVTWTLVGHVDNSADPQITVDVQASYTTPAQSKRPVPIMIEFGRFGGAGALEPDPAGKSRPSPTAGATAASTRTASSRTTTV